MATIELDHYDSTYGYILSNANERWELTESTRHDVNGWRCTRYLRNSFYAAIMRKDAETERNADIANFGREFANGLMEEPDTFTWDESYMFFVTLDEARQAFISEDLQAGRMAF